MPARFGSIRLFREEPHETQVEVGFFRAMRDLVTTLLGRQQLFGLLDEEESSPPVAHPSQAKKPSLTLLK